MATLIPLHPGSLFFLFVWPLWPLFDIPPSGGRRPDGAPASHAAISVEVLIAGQIEP
jgi:hypothetical protein